MRRLGFTLIELIFVIVIMGILSKFGIEFLARAYDNFIFSSINNSLQAQSAIAVETVASRLQYRIKDSIIARQPGANLNNYQALSSSTYGDTATILEWVGSDIEGFRGNSQPNWSGIIDLDASTAPTTLNSPETNTTAINTLIGVLSNGGSSIADAAIYFVGSDSDINNYGWNGVALADHNTSVMHPINSTGNPNEFISSIGVNFSGTDIFEYYKLAWTAYAVSNSDFDGDGDLDLVLHYDYQPWNGDNYLLKNDGTDTKNELLMDYKIINTEINDNIAKMKVETILNGNSFGTTNELSKKIVLKFIKVNNQWKLGSIQ